jgi:hypothetical protein
MGGGLMQLVAYGAQDIYLTGNPQITFFKVVYRRHTNFSMESIRQTLNGGHTGVISGTSTCTVSRNGDLVNKVFVTAPALLSVTDGSALVSEVELEIGGQRIDRHYKEWHEVWNELSTDESKAVGLKAMQGCIGTHGASGTGCEQIQIPLNFWFCRNPGLALPLIALQYHEVKLKFTWGNAGVGLNPEVWCDYIYLDTDERRRFAQVSHEYLIEQIQKETYTSGTGDKKLNFNHPVKELIWVNATSAATAGLKYQIKLNGHDRFAAQPQEYFTLRQPFDYHTAVPRQNLPVAAQLSSNMLTKSGTSIAVTTCTHVANEVTTGKGLGNAASNESLDAINTMCAFIGADFTRFNYVAASQVAIATATDIASYAAGFAAGTSGIALLATSALQIALKDLTGRQLELTGTFFQNPDAGSITTTTVTLLQVVPGLAADTAATTADVVDLDVVMLFFDKQVLKVGDDGAIDAGGETTISSFKVFEPVNTLASEARTSKMTKNINVYSFGLKPEEHQPSGTCNFSRIDNAQLNVSDTANTGDGGGNIYAVNYNVLRIMSGMGGLAYSN